MNVSSRMLPALATIVPICLAGCTSVRAYFPSRDEIYKPVPLSVGEPRLRGGDTVYVVTGAGYQLEATARHPLPDARRALDHAARRFHRHTGRWPARVLVQLAEATGEKAHVFGGDADAGAAPRPGRAVIVRLPEPPRYFDESWGAPLADVATPVARLWLRAYAQDRRGFDTSRTSDDARLPAWLEEALAELVAPSRAREARFDRLARHPRELLPLLELLDGHAPGDSANARGGIGTPRAVLVRHDRAPREDSRQPLPRAELFAAQSHAFAQFLIAREGSDFLARLTARLADGATFREAVREAETLPANLAILETSWREWLLNESVNREASAFDSRP
jgi:hypothetical protein